MSSINTDLFRDALSTFATGITVITAKDAADNPIGITVNSFSSVSLNPSLVLWSLANDTKEFDAFIQAQRFCINVLNADQQALSERFANPYHDKFENVDTTPGLYSIPKLNGCVSYFECSLWQQYNGGDHTIIVGQVEQFEHNGSTPLVFYKSQYLTVSES